MDATFCSGCGSLAGGTADQQLQFDATDCHCSSGAADSAGQQQLEFVESTDSGWGSVCTGSGSLAGGTADQQLQFDATDCHCSSRAADSAGQ